MANPGKKRPRAHGKSASRPAGRRAARAGVKARPAPAKATRPRRALSPTAPPKAVRRPSPIAASQRTRAAGRATSKEPRGARPRRATSEIGVLEHHMDYSSHDIAQVKRFYTELLGFGEFSHEPKFDYLYVRTGPGSSLGFMPPLPGPPEQWRPPREPSIYLIVADVDHAHRTLVGKGVAFEQPPTNMPWGHRTAVLRDPEGRLICLAQAIDR